MQAKIDAMAAKVDAEQKRSEAAIKRARDLEAAVVERQTKANDIVLKSKARIASAESAARSARLAADAAVKEATAASAAATAKLFAINSDTDGQLKLALVSFFRNHVLRLCWSNSRVIPFAAFLFVIAGRSSNACCACSCSSRSDGSCDASSSR